MVFLCFSALTPTKLFSPRGFLSADLSEPLGNNRGLNVRPRPLLALVVLPVHGNVDGLAPLALVEFDVEGRAGGVGVVYQFLGARGSLRIFILLKWIKGQYFQVIPELLRKK